MQHRNRWVSAVWLGLLVAAAGGRAHAQVPDGYKVENIGQPALTGTTEIDDAFNGLWTLYAGGSGIGGSSDQFLFAYRRLQGNGNLTLRFRSRDGVPATDPAQSGPMLRASNAPDAPFAFLAGQGDRKITPYYRYEAGAPATDFDIGNRGRVPAPGAGFIFQRIEREGDRFTSLISLTGTEWTSLVSVALPNMPSSLLAGIAATRSSADATDPLVVNYDFVGVGTDLSPRNLTAIARDAGALAVWDAVPGAEGYHVYARAIATDPIKEITTAPIKETSFEVQGVLQNGNPGEVYVSAVIGGREGPRVLAAVIPSPPVLGAFQGINVNTVQAGSQTLDANGVITLQGAGHAIGAASADSGRSDGFYYLAAPQTGDATATVRLLAGPAADRADPGRQAGLMFRESLDQDARFVMIEVTSGHGVRLNRRTAAGVVATATDVPVADATARPIWLRVVRAGNKLTAFIAEDKDGKEFRQAGDPITLDGFTGPGFVGLALSPHTGVDARPTGGLELGQAQFDNLSVK